MIVALLAALHAGATFWNYQYSCGAELDAQDEYMVVYDGVMDETGRHYVLRPPATRGRVKLDGFFVYMNMVADLVRPIGIQFGRPPLEIAAKAYLEWQARNPDLLFNVNFGIMRGPVLNRRQIGPVAAFDRLLLDPMERIYGPLPARYARQGPERAELAPLVRRQDRQELYRTTRFSLSRFTKPLAYGQVLISRGPAERLHVTEAWGDEVADLVRVEPGQVVGEFGRLAVEHPNRGFEAYSRDQVTPLRDRISANDTNALVLRMLFQKVLAWVNSDARLDRLLIQVNPGVERRLLAAGVPLYLGQRRELQKTWTGGRTIKEAVYAFDRRALLQGEDVLFNRVLEDWFRYALRQPHFRFARDRKLMLYFPPNEGAVLSRLGLYQSLFGRPLALEAFGNWDTQIVMGLDQIPAALAYLHRKKYEAGPVREDADHAVPLVAETETGERRQRQTGTSGVATGTFDLNVGGFEREHRERSVHGETEFAAGERDDAIARVADEVGAREARTPVEKGGDLAKIREFVVPSSAEKAEEPKHFDRRRKAAQGER